MKNRKDLVLVTGGAGFIGSNIVDALLKDDYAVRILDDFSTGNAKNVAHLEGKIELISGDISKKDIVDKAVDGVSYIFHEAAQVSVVDSITNPSKTWETNIRGTKLLLNAAVRNKVKKIVIASSANVYGTDPTVPKKEDMKVKAGSPYGESKLMGEFLAESYHLKEKLNSVCLRYFNVYGPRQNPYSEYSGVISRFIERMSVGQQPTIYGDGKQTRDFIYVEDVVAANLLAMKSKIGFGVYNIATGKETSLNDLIDCINEVLKSNIKPIHEAERQGDIRRSVADISKAKKELGFEPKYNLKAGLTKTIEWMKEQKRLEEQKRIDAQRNDII